MNETEYLNRLFAWIKTWPLTKKGTKHIWWGKAPTWVNNPQFRKIRDQHIVYVKGGTFYLIKAEADPEYKELCKTRHLKLYKRQAEVRKQLHLDDDKKNE